MADVQDGQQHENWSKMAIEGTPLPIQLEPRVFRIVRCSIWPAAESELSLRATNESSKFNSSLLDILEFARSQ